MKLLLNLLLIVTLLVGPVLVYSQTAAPAPVGAHAQLTDTGSIPDAYLTQPIRQWQLNLTTLFVICTIAGRVYSSLRNGGGLIGIWRGIMYGENVPKPIAQDYKVPPI